MSEQTARLVDRIRARLRATIRRITLADATYGFVLTLGVAAAIWLLSVAIEAGFWLGETGRSVLVGSIAAVVVGVALYFLGRPLLQLAGLLEAPSEEDIARQIGDHYPEVSDRLVNLLQLAEGQRSHAPPPMIDQAVQRLGEDIESVDFEAVEDFQHARWAGRLATLPIIGLLVFLLAAPTTFLDASERLLNPQTTFERPAPFQLTVAPGDVELVRGDSLRIQVDVSGPERPEALDLQIRDPEGNIIDEVSLTAEEGDASFAHTVASVRETKQYRVQAEPVQTGWYTATTRSRPLVRTLAVEVTPPAYTGLPPETLSPNVGNVSGLPGTRVDLEADLGGPDADQAWVAFDGERQDSLALDIENGTATGDFVLNAEGSYRIHLESGEGIGNRDPIRYDLELREDAAPSITLLSPPSNAALGEDFEAPLRMQINDDYGFTRLALRYRVSERRYGSPDAEFSTVDLPLEDPDQTDQRIDHIWELRDDTNLDLMPGDAVEYYVEVWDNDAVSGPKSDRTQTQRLHVPSLADRYDQLDQRQTGVEEQMQRLQDQSEAVSEEFEELRDDLRESRQADWEDERRLDQIQERQENLEDGIDELSQQMEEARQQMQDQDLVSPETQAMYEELQETVREIDAPELMEAMEELREAMMDNDLQQMMESMEDFEFNEEQFQERLERSMELFEQIRMQQDLDEMSRRTEELLDDQERIADETEARRDEDQEESEDGDPGDPASEANHEDLAQDQDQARSDMEALEERMDELAERAEEAGEERLQELRDELQEQDISQQMQDAIEDLQSDQLDSAMQNQEQAQSDLQQMRDNLQSMQESMQEDQMEISMGGLRYALRNVLDLSQNQEELRNEVEALSSDSPTLRDLAPEQSHLQDGLETVSDSLRELAQSVPQMSRAVQRETGNALRAMDEAITTMSDQEGRQASSHQRTSMTHLNELALLLSRLLDQMMNQEGMGGMSMEDMMEQLQDMAGDQGELNERIQEFLNDVQGERLSVDEEQRREQLAQEQERLQSELDDIRRERRSEDILGDLDRIAEQMEETIDELRENRQDRHTLERQEEIHTRLLDTQRSLRDQDQEERRRGEDPEDDFLRASPEDLTPEQQAERLRRDLIRALDSGYAPDYEDLIRRYFDRLEEDE